MPEEPHKTLPRYLSAYAYEKGMRFHQGIYHDVLLLSLSWRSQSVENVIQIAQTSQGNEVVLKHLSGVGASAKNALVSMLSSFLTSPQAAWKDCGMLPNEDDFPAMEQFLDTCCLLLEQTW